jgi:uncharacterized membrane protein
MDYKKIRYVIIAAIIVLMALGVFQNSILIALAAVTFGIVTFYLLRQRRTEIVYDERTVLIRSKAASTTLAIITAVMAITGLSLLFLSGQGIGNYEQIGYLLAFQASIILVLNTLLTYYYRKKLGG